MTAAMSRVEVDRLIHRALDDDDFPQWAKLAIRQAMKGDCALAAQSAYTLYILLCWRCRAILNERNDTGLDLPEFDLERLPISAFVR